MQARYTIMSKFNASEVIMLPDATLQIDNAKSIRELVKQTGLTQTKLAKKLGISDRALRLYMNEKTYRKIPYALQYCLEILALNAVRGSQCDFNASGDATLPPDIKTATRGLK